GRLPRRSHRRRRACSARELRPGRPHFALRATHGAAARIRFAIGSLLMAGHWLRVDERTDVLSSTDLLAIMAPRLKKYPSDWKWMILAAHNGAQGALVCAIQDTSSANILTLAISSRVAELAGNTSRRSTDRTPRRFPNSRKQVPKAIWRCD